MFQDLIVFQKTYDLILWLFPIVNRFPKKQRFVLGQQIENELIEILRGIILANQKQNKLEYLQYLSVRLDVLRILIRLAKDLRFLNFKQYEEATKQLNEIGKLLNGWIKKFS